MNNLPSLPSVIVLPTHQRIELGLDTEFDTWQEEFEQQELRQRMRRASTRADRREHHLAKKNAAPTLGDLIAPGVPNDVRLVFGDKRLGSFA